jgi:putative transposase
MSRPPSVRSRDDEVLKGDIARIHEDHHDGIYGIEKVWWQCQREGIDVGRDRVARLMRELGLRGVVRGGYKTATTTSDTEQKRPEDLVKRNFKTSAPNRLWVADITYVWTWEGFAYTAFVTDVFARYIVGWRVGTSLSTDLPLDALEMAIWTRRGQSLEHLVHHSDRGVQYLSIVYTERLEEAGVAPSVGSKGDSYDNALAETINGLYKTESTIPKGPWRNAGDLEIATAEWVEFYDKKRLHGSLRRMTPAEFEADYWAGVNHEQLWSSTNVDDDLGPS